MVVIIYLTHLRVNWFKWFLQIVSYVATPAFAKTKLQ